MTFKNKQEKMNLYRAIRHEIQQGGTTIPGIYKRITTTKVT